jgi:hypothetical protein
MSIPSRLALRPERRRQKPDSIETRIASGRREENANFRKTESLSWPATIQVTPHQFWEVRDCCNGQAMTPRGAGAAIASAAVFPVAELTSAA